MNINQCAIVINGIYAFKCCPCFLDGLFVFQLFQFHRFVWLKTSFLSRPPHKTNFQIQKQHMRTSITHTTANLQLLPCRFNKYRLANRWKCVWSGVDGSTGLTQKANMSGLSLCCSSSFMFIIRKQYKKISFASYLFFLLLLPIANVNYIDFRFLLIPIVCVCCGWSSESVNDICQ